MTGTDREAPDAFKNRRKSGRPGRDLEGPDPLNTPMTLEEEERMGLKQILDRYRQIQRPVKTWEQMREELIVRLLLGRPTLTREKAAKQIDAF